MNIDEPNQTEDQTSEEESNTFGVETPNYLDMSDDEIDNMSFPPEEMQEQTAPEEKNENEEFTSEVEEDHVQAQEYESYENEEEDGVEDSSMEVEESLDEDDEDDEEEDEKPQQQQNDLEVNYETAYKEIFAPFKANGRDIQVHSVDDARRLMQMGANYNKKMQGLKPHLKIVKMLEKNDLLDESKLALAIDVMSGNPDAIAQVAKNSGIDPLNLDIEQTQDYQPKDHTVSDNEVELESVLQDLKHSPSFKKTIDVVNNELDAASKEDLLSSPEDLRIINSHIESGIYDDVMGVVETQRALGKLTGLSDLDAYKQVGQALEKSGYWANKQQANVNQNQDFTQSQQQVNKQKEQQRVSRRKAASSPASAKSKSAKQADFNPLGLSDEDFEKEAAKLGLSHI